MELIKKEDYAIKEQAPKEEMFKIAMGSRIKASDDIEENEYLLRIENTNKFSKGNISGWIGRAKSKKTFALTMFVASLCGKISFDGKFNANKHVNVLWVDTEQSRSDVQKITRRIKSLIGSDDDLLMYGLRPLSPKERIQVIEILLKFHKDIEVLIIDGIRDLLMDINNAVESTEVMTLLMKWSYEYNIHIATVLHQNKSDHNSRGHIGAELENKSETIIRITKDDNDKQMSWIEEVYGRGRGFDEFSFFINDEGLPQVEQDSFIYDEEDDQIY